MDRPRKPDAEENQAGFAVVTLSNILLAEALLANFDAQAAELLLLIKVTLFCHLHISSLKYLIFSN